MVELHADLGSGSIGDTVVVSIAPRVGRDGITPGALVRAGSRQHWEWVRVELVAGDEALVTRMLPRAPAVSF